MKALVVLVVMTSTAHAETAEELTQTARDLARAGHCAELPAIGRRVDKLDDDYYTRVYSLDPVIAGCKQVEEKPREPIGEPKDPDVALGLSLGFTAGGLALLLGGNALDSQTAMEIGGTAAFIGPFTGHIYTGHMSNTGLAFQGTGLAVAVVGVGAAVLSCHDECRGDSNPKNTLAAFAIFGGALFAIGSFSEIGTAADSANEYNREHGFKATVVPTGNGLAIAGTF